LSLDDVHQERVAADIVEGHLNVRQAEELVRKLLAKGAGEQKKEIKEKGDADLRQLQEKISQKLGQPVVIRHTVKGSGKLTISYSSLDEFDGILGLFGDLDL